MITQIIIQTERKIMNNRQETLEYKEVIELHENKVVTPSENIPIRDVFDVSYRELSTGTGFLYLHTVRGVRAFMVHDSPDDWMEEMKSVLDHYK